METLVAFLDRVAERYGPQPALLFKPRYRTDVWSYSRLWKESRRVAGWLQRQRVQKGDRVVLWAPNSPWWVAVYFGTVRLGGIVVPLDIRSGDDFVDRVIAQSEPRLALLSRLTSEAWTYSIPATEIEQLPSLLDRAPDLAPAAVAPDDLAEIIFTSGTTGDPKGVILTHANITSNASSVSQVIPDLPYFRLLSVLPLSHMLEQSVGLLLSMGRGGSIFYPSSRQSTELFRAFQEQKITTVILVPQALQLFLDAIEREVRKQGRGRMWGRLQAVAEHAPRWARRLLFHSLHRRLGGQLDFFVSGGAPLDPELIERWERVGVRVLQGYGATETAPVVTATSFEDHNPRSVGRPVPGVQARIAADGEILVKGSNVTPGYWRNQEATEVAFENGWYKTGDLGELDERGYLYLRGRKKNLIVLSNGQNVYPEDVERALIQTGSISDAVVLGFPTPRGTEVHAILLFDSAPSDPATVVRQANAQLAPHQRIQGFTVWPKDDFPRTHTLKVKRQEVFDFLLQQQQDAGRQQIHLPSRPAESDRPVLRLLSEAARLPVERLTPDTTLGDDAGLDSLGRVELLAAMEGELGIYIDEAQVGPDTTVAQLEKLVAEHGSGARPEFPAWPLSPLAVLARTVLQLPLFGLLDRIAPAEVRGSEIVERLSPPVLFVANHTSHLDSPTILRALPARLRRRVALAAAADYFFSRRWLGITVGLLLNAFPFSRTTAVRPTLEHCAMLLDHGWSILLYPEGTRSTNGRMGTFKSGVGLLAVDLEVQVVPVRLQGLERVLPKGQAVPQRGRVSVTFGAPLRFPGGTPYAHAAREIEAVVRSLTGAEEPETMLV